MTTNNVWTPTPAAAPAAGWAPPQRLPAEVDTECYPDWWLFKIWLPDGKFYSIDMHEQRPLNREAIRWFLENFTIYTFNGDNYDLPMISYAMAGADNRQLKQANDNIIKGGLKRWDFYRAYGIDQPRGVDHVDIMEVAPGVRIGLKAYMGRMHSRTIQDLPYSPDQPTSHPMRVNLDTYCSNDLDGTRGLRVTCKERLALRERLGEQYGVDLRSKSDAQMAEAIIKTKLGFFPEKRIVPHGFRFRYKPPSFIKFSTPQLQNAFQIICNADFIVNDVDQIRGAYGAGEDIVDTDGKKIKTGVVMPLELKDLLIRIGGSKYKIGIGGLHSQESGVQYHTIAGKHTIQLDDVASYYPSLIINQNITPAQLGPRFQEIYQEAYYTRLEAKLKAAEAKAAEAYKRGDKTQFTYWSTIAEGLKILLNGTFGKLFSKYSIMFAPELGIQVTITGQLCLLMLIESLELHGISVVSANTDGIVTRCPAGREWLRDSCIRLWSQITGLKMESEVARSLYARDVNSYVLIFPDGSHKSKGAFAESGVLAGMQGANPEKDICADAVIEYLKTGKPLATTILECRDIRKFIVIRSVKGGGVYNTHGAIDAVGADEPEYLGKTVRWYYAAGETRCIHYASNGNKVAGSDGARPAMTLPLEFPADVDYARYHADAVKMLETLGLTYQQ